MEDSVRWSLKVSRETDEALRAYLGRTGARKGDLSRFVQEAVRERLRKAPAASGKRAAPAREREDQARALQEIRARTRRLSRARFEKLVADAVAYTRARR